MSRSLIDYFLTGEITDISTAGTLYIPVPDGGEVVEIYSAIDNAITTADATLTSKIGGTAITGGALTITQSGSAAGDVDSTKPTALNTVATGGSVEIETDGGSSTACRATVTVVIRRGVT